MPSSILNGVTPFQTLCPHKSLFPIEPRVFGCTCFVQDVRPHVSKLDPKSLKCTFLSYSLVQKGYRCYYPSLRRYLVSVDVSFLDLPIYTLASPTPASIPPLTKPPITQVYTRCQNPPVSSPTPTASTLDPVSSDDLPIALRKGKCQCVHPISSFCSYNHLSSHSWSFIASLDSISLPNTVREALSHRGWHSVMVEEMQALDDNDTWNLVQLHIGKKVIGCHWVFTVKVNPDSSVAQLKARPVAKGYAQTYGVVYSDTFSLVSKITSFWLFISIAATYN